MKKNHVVISRFKEVEDPKLIFNEFCSSSGLNCEMFVYEKGGGSFGTSLPNIGREIHTILYHIVSNYSDLPDAMISLAPSHVANHKRKIFVDLIERCKNIENIENYYFEPLQVSFSSQLDFRLDGWLGSNDKNRKEVISQRYTKSEIRPFSEWFKRKICVAPSEYCGYTSQFVVGKNLILKTSNQKWKEWLKDVEESGENSEICHFFERSWMSIFSSGQELDTLTSIS